MRTSALTALLLTAIVLASPAAPAQKAAAHKTATEWLTTPDRSALFAEQPQLRFTQTAPTGQTIDVDDAKTYQTMDGFGFALTGGSAQLLTRMDPAKRAALLHELFTDGGDSIGVSYLRATIGSSDMNDHVYTYDDLPAGETDPTLAKFSLDPDRADVIPVLKQILALDPSMKILASPWSAPSWMKTNGRAKGGVLRPEYFAAYAAYLVKYIEGMKAEGIPIDAITIQNEPLNENNTPSMLMLESEQADFIAHDLGPALQKAGLRTKIILYDHNLDHPAYPLAILKDPEANQYIDGSGFHLYGGTVDAMTRVHDAFPQKNLYFTEQMVVDPRGSHELNVSQPVSRIVIGATRNWSKNILLWNLAADPSFGPHTASGGCPVCQGAITIDGSSVTRNSAYYTIAHASKFVRPGSVRIESNILDSLPNVAFRTPAGETVVIVANISDTAQSFAVRNKGKQFTTTLNAGAVGTYIW